MICSAFTSQVTVDGQPWSSGEPGPETRLTIDERVVLLEQLNDVRLHPVADPARRSIDEAPPLRMTPIFPSKSFKTRSSLSVEISRTAPACIAYARDDHSVHL